MTIEDVIQELVDIKNWVYAHDNDEIYSLTYVERQSGNYNFIINMREQCILVGRINGYTLKIYFFTLKDEELSAVRTIYRKRTEERMKEF